MGLLYKAGELKQGYNLIVGSENSGLKWLEFGRIFLPKQGVYQALSGNREECFSILNGECSVEISGSSFKAVRYTNIGVRDNVFSGKPTMVYIPREAEYKIVVESEMLHLGIFKAPSRRATNPILIKPGDCQLAAFGAANWQREVCLALGEKADVDRLIVGETYSPAGNWSSYPPHKHDTFNPPKEAPYEEIYFFLMEPSQGFGIQRVYTAKGSKNPLNEVYVIEDGDTVVIPGGYHPVVAAAGYRIYYLWALAGESREYAAWSDDLAHTWVRELEAEGLTKK